MPNNVPGQTTAASPYKVPDTASIRPATPPQGSKRVDLDTRFVWGKLLGRGSYADVVLIRDKDPPYTPYAMKVIDKRQIKSKHQMQELLREIRIMRVVKQQHIVRLYEVFETERKVYLQMEYVSGGELFDRITAPGRDSLPELESRSIVHQILSAVAYLHRHDIVHRDLKPENILTSGDEERIVVKIADFGLANLLQADRLHAMKTQCGSFPYVAPEVLKSAGYGKEVDMWAIGVITYVLVSGYFPFNADDDAHMLRTILACKWTFFSPAFDNVSQAAKDFIAHLIVADPARRMTAEQALRHRWFHPHAQDDAQLFDLVLGENAHDHTNISHSAAWAKDPEKHKEMDALIEKIQLEHHWTGLESEIDHEGVDLVWPKKGEHYVGEQYQQLMNTLGDKRKERDIHQKPNAHEKAQALLKQMNQAHSGYPPGHYPQQPQPQVQTTQTNPPTNPTEPPIYQPKPQNAAVFHQDSTHSSDTASPLPSINVVHPLPVENALAPGPYPQPSPRTSSLESRTPSPQPSGNQRSMSGLSNGKQSGGFLYKLFHPKSVESEKWSTASNRSSTGGSLNTTSLPHSLEHQGITPLPGSNPNKILTQTMPPPGVAPPEPTKSPGGLTGLVQNLRQTMAGHKKNRMEERANMLHSIDQALLTVDGSHSPARIPSPLTAEPMDTSN